MNIQDIKMNIQNIDWIKVGRISQAGIVLLFTLAWALLLITAQLIIALIHLINSNNEKNDEELLLHKRPFTAEWDRVRSDKSFINH